MEGAARSRCRHSVWVSRGGGRLGRLRHTAVCKFIQDCISSRPVVLSCLPSAYFSPITGSWKPLKMEHVLYRAGCWIAATHASCWGSGLSKGGWNQTPMLLLFPRICFLPTELAGLGIWCTGVFYCQTSFEAAHLSGFTLADVGVS